MKRIVHELAYLLFPKAAATQFLALPTLHTGVLIPHIVIYIVIHAYEHD